MPPTPDWSPERLRKLDMQVHEAEGAEWRVAPSSGCRYLIHPSHELASMPHEKAAGAERLCSDSARYTPRYSLGEGLWPLIRRDKICTNHHAIPERWVAHDGHRFLFSVEAPTPEIAVCLALLAKKNVRFE